MLAILMNSIILAQFDYSDRDSVQFKNKALNFIGDMFTILFLIEASMKIAA